jgi:lipoate-protein ligase A
MRCEEKVPNGKLVCIEVFAKADSVERVKITGDFFIHPEDTVNAIENSFIGVRLSVPESELLPMLKKAIGDAQLIGVTSEDLARMFRKAVGG